MTVAPVRWPRHAVDVRRASTAAACAVVVIAWCTGCAPDNGSAKPPSSTSAQSSTTTSQPTTSTTPSSADVQSLADDLRQQVPDIVDVLVYDETTDPNNLLGRPTGYLAAASLADRRASGAEGIGRGAVLEVWPTARSAEMRADYIHALQDGNPALGAEYHHLRGEVLLRVSGELPPSADDEYAQAFGD